MQQSKGGCLIARSDGYSGTSEHGDAGVVHLVGVHLEARLY